MRPRKHQVEKTEWKVCIYPKPYEIMVEAVDRYTAKQNAITSLNLRKREIERIIANKIKITICIKKNNYL